ncbi:MAG: MarR family transcriptional regulator [Nocardioides sp.]|nr:MarR family transcriptional regulator [Nocardioides sp.]
MPHHLLLSATTLAMASDLVVYAARLMRTMRRVLDLPASVRVLTILDTTGPLGITDLAKADNCSQPTMSAQIAQLVESGLVTKAPNPTDGRGSVVTLTDAGRDELAEVRERISAMVADKLRASGRTPEEVAAAVSVLRDLVEDTAPVAPVVPVQA